MASLATAMQPVRSGLLVACMATVALMVATIYYPALDNGFHFDDIGNIVETTALHIPAVSVDAIAQAVRESALPNRPLPNALFAIDWWRGGGDPGPFQQTNVAIHVLCSIAVFGLLILLLRVDSAHTQRPRLLPSIALICAAAWALHPIQLQAVTYIVQRMASMAALFFVLAVCAYIAARRAPSPTGRIGWALLCLSSGLCAVYSKENALMLPAVLILAEYGLCRPGQPSFRYWFDRYLWLAVFLAIAYVIADLLFLEGPLRVRSEYVYIKRDFTLEERLLTQPRVVLFHLGQMLWPLPDRFSLEHDFAISRDLFSPPTTIAAIAALFLWTIAGFATLFSRRNRVVGFLLLFPLATLIPESSFHGLEMVFEHRMYLPSVALLGLSAVFMQRAIVDGRMQPRTLYLGAALVVGALAASTSARIPEWRDEVTLGRANVRTAPHSARAWLNYGTALQARGDREQSRQALLRGVELAGDNRILLEVGAVALAEMNYRAEAIPILQRLQELNRRVPFVRLQRLLGDLLLSCADPDGAEQAWRIALRISPDNASILQRLASLDRSSSLADAAPGCRPDPATRSKSP